MAEELGREAVRQVGTGPRYRARYEYTSAERGGYLSRVRGGTSASTLSDLFTVESRDARANITQDALGNGLVERRTFDVVGRMTELNVRPARTGVGSPRTVLGLGYLYDLNSNVAVREERIPTAGRRADVYEFDGLDRLRRWRRCNAGGTPCPPGRAPLRDTTYTHDATGNLTQTSTALAFGALVETFSFEPSRPHTITSQETRTLFGTTTRDFVHDAAGRRTESDGSVISYTAFDLPRSAEVAGGAETYAYDAVGQGSRRVGPAGATLDATTYLGELFELRRENGEHGVLRVMGETGTIATVVLRPGRPPQTLYHHKGVLGSASAISGNGGVLAERQLFDPFGIPIDADGSTLDSPTRPTAVNDSFTGHERDRSTGLVNARGRMYDPRTRRFLTTVPLSGLGGSQSWNPFSVAGSPGRISFGHLPVRRLVAHTHPLGDAIGVLSGVDIRTTRALGQRSTYLLVDTAEGGVLSRHWVR